VCRFHERFTIFIQSFGCPILEKVGTPLRPAAVHVLAVVLAVIVAAHLSAVLSQNDTPSRAIFPPASQGSSGSGAALFTVPTPGWNVTITNKGDPRDYPISIVGGENYALRFAIRVEVPQGQIAELRIEIGGFAFFEPHPRSVDLFPRDPMVSELGPGIHELNQTVGTVAPVVYRDSYSYPEIVAWVRGPQTSYWDAFDSYGYRVDVWPVEGAVDVVVHGTVLDWVGPEINKGSVVVDEVVSDPSGAILVGQTLDVNADPGEFPADIQRFDVVEIRGDFHPAENPARLVMWKDNHSVVRIGRSSSAGQGMQDPVDSWMWLPLVGASLGGAAIVIAIGVRRATSRNQPSAPKPKGVSPRKDSAGPEPPTRR